MFKRCTLLLLVCTLLTGWVCPARAADSNEETYTLAQRELLRYFNGENSKSLDALCADFAALGRYEESSSFLYYTSILRDLEAEDFSRIELYLMLIRSDADFCAMMEDGELPTIEELEAYALGRMAEAENDDQLALEYYQKCNAMLDSQERMVGLYLATPTPKPTPTPTPTPKIVKENIQAGDYKITTYNNGTCSITDYIGKAKTLDIPEKLNGYSVTSIGDTAFMLCGSLTSITIPDSVTSIGDSAFANCAALTSITIPDSVTSIDDWAFASCSSLTSITIPDSVTSIGNGAFCACKALISITIPDSVTSIGNGAFEYCSSLTSITIPDSVTSIDDYAFCGCDSLTSITIPDSVTSIGNYAFEACSYLTSIAIPDSVTFIGDGAFWNCSYLTSITIPDSVIAIGDAVFYNCPNLTLRVKKNSPAHQYAIDNNLPYVTY